jgi:tyrosine-protein kinase Etk/Wzc
MSKLASEAPRPVEPSLNRLGRIAGEIAEIKRIWAAVEKNLTEEERHPCVLVTSAAPGEGKSLLTAGLAALLAQRGDRRVIAADLNWHRPSLHRYFGLQQSIALEQMKNTEVLTDLVLPSGMDQLGLFTAPILLPGAPLRSSLNQGLGSQIVRQLKTACDLLIVDASSVYPTNRTMMDPVVLSREADAVLLIVKAGATACSQVKRARYAVETSGVRFIGLVFNPFPSP